MRVIVWGDFIKKQTNKSYKKKKTTNKTDRLGLEHDLGYCLTFSPPTLSLISVLRVTYALFYFIQQKVILFAILGLMVGCSHHLFEIKPCTFLSLHCRYIFSLLSVYLFFYVTH